MRRLLISFVACLLVASSGCQKSKTPAPAETETNAPAPGLAASPGGPALDACSLLTTEEIAAIQGAGFQSAKASAQSEGELSSAQCFFALPSFVQSISLQVVQKGNKPGGRDLKQAWQGMFPPEKLQERETEGGKKKLPPRRISGLGEEAFWTGGPAGGLYVLQGNHYIRVSLGGGDDEETKIKKSSALAQLVLQRL
jgi:hypothetical protein